MHLKFPKLAAQTKLLRNSIKDLTDAVSDHGHFNSCQSTVGSSTDDESENIQEVRIKKGKKRSRKKSPLSGDFLKKGNFNKSPNSTKINYD